MAYEFIGVDPGRKGALAKVSNSSQIISINPMPYIDKELDYSQIYNIFKECKYIIIESVHSMPKQGIASTAKFMKEFGILIGIAHACVTSSDCKTKEVILVPPQTWKKKILGKGKHDKQDSINKALEYVSKCDLLPTKRSRVPNDGMAEALLIALSFLVK